MTSSVRFLDHHLIILEEEIQYNSINTIKVGLIISIIVCVQSFIHLFIYLCIYLFVHLIIHLIQITAAFVCVCVCVLKSMVQLCVSVCYHCVSVCLLLLCHSATVPEQHRGHIRSSSWRSGHVDDCGGRPAHTQTVSSNLIFPPLPLVLF